MFFFVEKSVESIFSTFGYFDLTTSQAPPPPQIWTSSEIGFFDVSENLEEKKIFSTKCKKLSSFFDIRVL